MSEAADILRKAKELIETKGWCQGAFSLDAEGNDLESLSEMTTRGVCFCCVGGIAVAGGYLGPNEAWDSPSSKLIAQAAACPIIIFNEREGRTKAEVLSAFDRAIALAEAGKS